MVKAGANVCIPQDLQPLRTEAIDFPVLKPIPINE
jgi:hypothetical protein